MTGPTPLPGTSASTPPRGTASTLRRFRRQVAPDGHPGRHRHAGPYDELLGEPTRHRRGGLRVQLPGPGPGTDAPRAGGGRERRTSSPFIRWASHGPGAASSGTRATGIRSRHHQRPREHVPRPSAALRHQRGHARHHTHRRQDLDHGHGPHQGVPEPDRNPSSRTTRSPHTLLPSDRPWLSVSTAIGPPTGTSRKTATETAATAASSSEAVVTSSLTRTRRRTSQVTTRSTSTAAPRLGNSAGRSSSETASPLTHDFPAAPHRTRTWRAPTAVASLPVAAGSGWWVVTHSGVQSAIVGPAELGELTRSGGDYEAYYSSRPATSFAAQVRTNDAQGRRPPPAPARAPAETPSRRKDVRPSAFPWSSRSPAPAKPSSPSPGCPHGPASPSKRPPRQPSSSALVCPRLHLRGGRSNRAPTVLATSPPTRPAAASPWPPDVHRTAVSWYCPRRPGKTVDTVSPGR